MRASILVLTSSLLCLAVAASDATACTTATVAIDVSWDTTHGLANGLTVNLGYRPDLVDIPGTSLDASVAGRVVNLSGVAGGLFGASDVPSGDPPRDQALNVGLATSTPLATGRFIRVVFDCMPGARNPTTSDFSCLLEAASSDGAVLPNASCVASVTVN